MLKFGITEFYKGHTNEFNFGTWPDFTVKIAWLKSSLGGYK